MTNGKPLEITNLSHAFGDVKALDNIAFSARAGKMTILLGKNGAGKTTLFSLITRLYTNRSGLINIFGKEIAAHPSYCLSKIGIVFQQRTLDLDLTVYQNLYYHCLLQGIGPKIGRKKIDEEIIRFDLTEQRNHKIRTLSGGQVRRVEIARSLLHDPKLLLMDECTSGLDVLSRKTILKHARDLCRDHHIAVLWATHILDEVENEDHLVVLHKGKVISENGVQETLKTYQSETTHDAFIKMTAS